MRGTWFQPALVVALRSGYQRSDLMHDCLAGLLVGVVALPLSMGLAIASGVNPICGLYTSIIGGLVVGLLGGSRVQIAGPAGAFVGLCAAGVKEFGVDGLAVATMMAGLLVLAMGLARLGRAISYIPTPVIIGFTTGIAVVIASTQLAPALGIVVPGPPQEQVLERIGMVWTRRAQVNGGAVLITLSTMASIVLLRRCWPRLPGAMVALVVMVAVTWLLHLQVDTIQSQYGALARHLPSPHLPSLGMVGGFHWLQLGARLQQLSGLALAIALLGAIESLLSAVVADGLSGHRHDSNVELVAQGVANILSPLFLGLPVTGVIARTSTNIRGGARTPISAIVHVLTVIAFLLLLGPLVAHIPLACLAGILLVVCWGMAEVRHWPCILRTRSGDAFLLLLAFGLTVLVGLTWAVILGVLLAMMFFVKRVAESIRIERDPSGPGDENSPSRVTIPVDVQVYAVNGPFFFGAATLIRDLDIALVQRPRAMILRLGHVPFIDSTAGFALRELMQSCRSKRVMFSICELPPLARKDLARLGLEEQLDPGLLCEDLAGSLRAVTPQARLVPAAPAFPL